MSKWLTTRFEIDLSSPQIMGIVNLTPDSFSDGGKFSNSSNALAHAEQLLKDGASILDVGAESTRPGSAVVSLEEELRRLSEVLPELVSWKVPISVDTYKPEVMRMALNCGVDIINDVWALRQPDAVDVVNAHARCGVCLMHMHASPQTMHQSHVQGDVLKSVAEFLSDRTQLLLRSGIVKERLVLDPGYGFGKTVQDNFALLGNQAHLLELGLPLLAGWSRKGSLGVVTGRSVEQRLVPSVVAAILAVEKGARIVRVHDVAETLDAIKVWCAVRDNSH